MKISPRSSVYRLFAVFAAVVAMGALATVGAGESGGASGPLGKPIVVMTEAAVVTNFAPYPEIPDVAVDYMKWVNAHGGIVDGSGVRHDLKVITCDDMDNPNQAAYCARQAASDHVVAVVGSYSTQGGFVVPILQANHIAWFGICCANAPQEFSSPVSFPTGSTAAELLGVGAYAGKLCKKTVLITGQSSASAFLENSIGLGMKAEGKKFFNVVDIPFTAQDYSPYVAEALNGNPDCFLILEGKNQFFSFLPPLEQAGGHQKILSVPGTFTPAVIKAFPSAMNYAIRVGSYPAFGSPLLATYRKALNKYEPVSVYKSLDWTGVAAEGTWTGYVEFTNIIATMKGPINNATFLKAASHTKALNSDGLVPTLNLTKDFSAAGYHKLFNRYVTVEYVSNGKLVPVDNLFHDISPAFLGKNVTIVIPSFLSAAYSR